MSTSMIADLADLRVWLAWQGEIKKPGALPDKVPWRARGRLGHGSSTDAE